jgi:hypothetical protein
MRLGELLVQREIITEKQLAKALDSQLIFGAHLGTCLIELGYVDEDLLGHLLAEIFKVRYATRDLIQEIPPHVIRTLNPGVVEKHVAIPFDLKEKILHVAMVNPRNLPGLDELSFVSGCRIEPWVSPEIRLVHAMELYYEVPRKLRYIVLMNRLDEKPDHARPAKKASSTTRAARAVAAAQAGSDQARLRPEPAVPVGHVEVAGGTWPAPIWTAEAGSLPPVRGVEDRLAQVSDELCRAEDSARIAKIALNYAVRGMARCTLLAVKGDHAEVWDTRGFRIDPERASHVRFPLTSEPVFGLLGGEPHYKGPVPGEPGYRGFFEALGIDLPSEILIIPVYLADRIAAIFCGDAGSSGAIQGATEDYVRLMRKLALAMNMLILKKKIHSA